MIYSPYQPGPLKIQGSYDPDSVHLFGFKFRPDVWQPGRVYELRSPEHPDLVLPSIYMGFYAEIVNPGISASTEPNWSTTSGGLTIESTGAIWRMQPFNMLPLSLIVQSSSWVAQGATISDQSKTDTSTQCRVTDVTATDFFYLTNSVTYSNGDKDDFTARFKVRER